MKEEVKNIGQHQRVEVKISFRSSGTIFCRIQNIVPPKQWLELIQSAYSF